MNLIDDILLNHLKTQEGFTPKSAWDYKQYTNGFGTRAKFPGEVIDQSEAENRLRNEAGTAALLVNQFAPDAPDGVKRALTSLTYNSGTDWMRSGLGDRIKSKDYSGAVDHFLQYNKAGGETLPGLVDRRKVEAAWFNPQQPSSTDAVPPILQSGFGRESAPQTAVAQATPITDPNVGNAILTAYAQSGTQNDDWKRVAAEAEQAMRSAAVHAPSSKVGGRGQFGVNLSDVMQLLKSRGIDTLPGVLGSTQGSGLGTGRT